MKLFSPAKINLGLKIPYRRDTDGYHEIESIFIKLDWGDVLEITTLSDSAFKMETEIELEGSAKTLITEVSLPENWNRNLVYRTWVFAKRINTEIPGLNIKMVKRIPPGGGLGGGSSNSAAVFQFLIRNGFLDQEETQRRAHELGADIPFFLQESNCWVTGIGEKLEPIHIANGYGILVVPSLSLDTKTMYLNLKKSLQKPLLSKTWKEQEGSTLLALERGDWASLQGILVNDFEAIAYQLQPSLGEIRDLMLAHGAEYSAMSGSGSTIYGLMRDEEHRNMLLPKFHELFPGLKVVPFSF